MIHFSLIEKIKLKINFNKKNKDKKRVAVLDEGKDSLYVNCEGVGPDRGLINRGKRNKFINTKWKVSKK